VHVSEEMLIIGERSDGKCYSISRSDGSGVEAGAELVGSVLKLKTESEKLKVKN